MSFTRILLLVIVVLACLALGGEVASEQAVPLLKAAYDGDLKQMKALLNAGVDINFQMKLKRDHDVLKQACGKCKVNLFVSDGTSALHWAAQQSQWKAVEFLLENGANVNLQRKDGWTALHYAANNGDLDMVNLLLSKGADITLLMHDTQFSALHFAANKGFVEVVRAILFDLHDEQLLLREGVQQIINVASLPDGLTAFWQAASGGYLSVLKLLAVVPGCDMSTISADESSPFHAACARGHFNVVKWLVEEHDVDVNTLRNDNAICLHDSIAFDFRDITQFMIDKGVNLNHRANGGVLPLEIAVHYDLYDSFMQLLLGGADSSLQTSSGMSLSEYAVGSSIEAILSFAKKLPEDWDRNNTVAFLNQLWFDNSFQNAASVLNKVYTYKFDGKHMLATNHSCCSPDFLNIVSTVHSTNQKDWQNAIDKKIKQIRDKVHPSIASRILDFLRDPVAGFKQLF